ncbi:uncharacterized protein CC84DRAFT_1257630 [Paraphaeosphaeria sporulosa]|uniref:Fungal N-terminal domain-containing protein n=1 Tax=Paraphaeosphaeria sporulosa TaxID=1460663 RepID=A0A177CQ41_9PLEO|nr:uncharacterized protein CC84DRAFT_1257630 [Paraphaeosphaeria sporulosa]OAG08867.1 hypothetical protein CC84DRAFT_1257630 [Paraphaeosphaeria sporulosa]
MEAAAAVVSFVGLAGPVAQGLKFLYDFTTDMKDCPKDIREMKTDLELVEALITNVIKQCNERDLQLRESVALAKAIARAQESVQDLKEALAMYMMNGKHRRFKFAAKLSQTQKLRTSLDRTKTIMFELKNQLQSDIVYDIRDTNQKILRTVEKTNKDLETHDRSVHHVAQRLQNQARTTNRTMDTIGQSVQQASDNSSEELTNIKLVEKQLERITDLLEGTTISPSPSSTTSTPALSREVSDFSVISSQETIATSIASSPSISRSVSQNPQPVDSISEHPLLQFRDNQFHFLVACIFTQRSRNQRLACQRASECLAAYPTPIALAKASEQALSQYFGGIGLQNMKPPRLIALAQAYVRDPPKAGVNRSKTKKGSCPESEITHLPWIGEQSVNTWWVYCCERTDVATKEKPLLEYIEHLKDRNGGAPFS